MFDALHVTALPLGPLQANCFLAAEGETGVIVDPGGDEAVVVKALARQGVTPAAILVTHGHFDHVGAVAALAERYTVPLYAGAADADELAGRGLSRLAGMDLDPITAAVHLNGEQELPLPFAVTAVPTPGHSLGSYTFAIGAHLFCGDLLFRGSIGRTDLPGGDMQQLLGSVALLMRRFPPQTVVHCGHGPDTSLGRELAVNPFLAPLRHAQEQSR